MPDQVWDLEKKPTKTVRLGVMGLINKSWMETSVIDSNDYKLEKSVSTGKEISYLLRKKFKCDLIISLTHMSNNEDMNLQNNDCGIDLCKSPLITLI